MGHRVATKLMTLIVLLFTLTLLVGCMNQEDYYTKDEWDAMIEELDQEYNYYHSELSKLRESLAETTALIKEANEASQMQRFIFMIIEAELLNEEFIFASIGDTIEGTVNAWSSDYIIIEMDREATVEATFTSVAPDRKWDMHLYLNNMSDPSKSFENITARTYTLNLKAGFNIIEIDSYYESDYIYIISITEII